MRPICFTWFAILPSIELLAQVIVNNLTKSYHCMKVAFHVLYLMNLSLEMMIQHLTQPIGELVPRPTVEGQAAELSLEEITDPAELWAVTKLGIPEDDPALAARVKEIRSNMLMESMRTAPGNERYVALYGLKQQCDKAHKLRIARKRVDDNANWIRTTAQA